MATPTSGWSASASAASSSSTCSSSRSARLSRDPRPDARHRAPALRLDSPIPRRVRLRRSLRGSRHDLMRSAIAVVVALSALVVVSVRPCPSQPRGGSGRSAVAGVRAAGICRQRRANHRGVPDDRRRDDRGGEALRRHRDAATIATSGRRCLPPTRTMSSSRSKATAATSMPGSRSAGRSGSARPRRWSRKASAPRPVRWPGSPAGRASWRRRPGSASMRPGTATPTVRRRAPPGAPWSAAICAIWA